MTQQCSGFFQNTKFKFIRNKIVFLMWAINDGDIWELIESDAGNAVILIRCVGGDNPIKRAARMQINQLFLDWKLLEHWCLNTNTKGQVFQSFSL